MCTHSLSFCGRFLPIKCKQIKFEDSLENNHQKVLTENAQYKSI